MKKTLSAREEEVLRHAVQGLTDDMIAQRLNIERGTVNSYWVRIRGKMGHLSRTELASRYVQSNADATSDLRLEAAHEASSEQRRALDAALAEIERLTALLDKRRR